jgi:K+-sensing histidine kinase KdpD
MKPLTNSEKYTDVDESRAPVNTRSSFLSHISHGIRTPLNSIMGFSHLLMERQMIDGKPKEYAQRIVYSSNVLLNFIENLIELSQYESNNYEPNPQPVNLNDLLWKVVENFVRKRKEQNLADLELAVLLEPGFKDITIITDYELLKKSVCRLVNLVSNIYRKGKLELGYKCINSNLVRIYIRPAQNTFSVKQDTHLLNENNESEAFESFNYEVLEHSVKLMGGRVCIDSIMNEYYLELPVEYEQEQKDVI